MTDSDRFMIQLCQVMDEREAWNADTLTARLRELGWLPEYVNHHVISDLLRRQVQYRKGALFKRVKDRSLTGETYGLASPLAECLEKYGVLGPVPVTPVVPTPTQWDRLLGSQTFDPDSLRESDEAES